MEKSAQHEEFAEEFELVDKQEAEENDDNELQDDSVNSLASFEHVSINFCDISLMERVNRVSAVSGNKPKGNSEVLPPLPYREQDPNKSLVILMPPKILLAYTFKSFAASCLDLG